MLKGDYEILGELKGRQMEGWEYDGPFDELPAEQQPGGHTLIKELSRGISRSAAQAHRVILWDEVGEAEGTGIVHIAPGCGAEDFALGKQYALPMVAPLEEEGHFVEGFAWLTGLPVAQVASPIFADLERKGLLYRVEPYTHRYPTCWRCKTELVFRLVEEWFISMGQVYDKPRAALTAAEKASSLRYQMMDVVDHVRWIPEFGYAREMDWLQNMHDWLISKKRYWGLALPVWVCGGCGHFEVIGSETELQERAVAGWETFEGHTPHRPYVDAVKLECPRCKGVMGRIPDVGNPWLDAGIVPFSTLHYRSDRDYWQRWYPAEWITESFPGQFRNWFYSLLAMATVMEGSPPFLQNFGFATLLGENGQEMHKSLGNAIEFNEAADRMGVDVMRWLFINQKPENDLLFGYPRGDDARRRFLLPLWNVYSFFVTYANLDGWTPASQPSAANLQLSILDRWILARLDQVVDTVTRDVEASDFLDSGQSLEGFLDDLSNWYVRRSRRRFWKSVPAGSYDPDKEAAYGSLYQVLVRLALTLAPFTPFLSESIYQNLVRTVDPKAPESVHHCAWPQADLAAVDQELLDQMALARQVASLGLSARSSAGLKVRQPLAKCLVYTGVKHPEIERWWVDPSGGASPLREIVMDELNVKELEFVADPHLLVTYLILPDNKLLGPRFGAQFPRLRQTLAAANPAEVAARVQAGLAVTIQLDGQEVELAPAEILVQTQPAAGLAVAAEREVTVAIDTDLTPQLRAEGLAREIVRRVQAMRKDAGFEIADRITTYYIAGGDLAPVMVDWNDYVRAETLSTALVAGQPPQEAFTEQQQVEGETLTLGILKNN